MQDFMAELKSMPIWFHWHWEQDKSGRQTKVPHAAKGGATGTSDDWSHTWVAYEEALSLKEEQHASGLGFKVPDGYFFLDADHYELEDPFMKLLLERFDSYTERSAVAVFISTESATERNSPLLLIRKVKKSSTAHFT